MMDDHHSLFTGVKQNTESLGNVILPPWSKGCPMEFVRVNREVSNMYVTIIIITF